MGFYLIKKKKKKKKKKKQFANNLKNNFCLKLIKTP